ncbi:MAG TPA: class I SAM-dependent methyltransferase, partial [Methylomirabilota bacterium]|nr:class I SAM-dependent methyltransferase [Methylomirabilota bacterium]
MNRKSVGALSWGLAVSPEGRVQHRGFLERLTALGYGLTYDAVVRRFPPYEKLLDEIAALVSRSDTSAQRSIRVLDIASGTGTVATRLARQGYAVVGLDSVEHLIAVAQRNCRKRQLENVTFRHLDAAKDPIPGAGTFDVVVSMHTLYWHPDPHALLRACRRALRPGGHGIFLTYSRPAHIVGTLRRITLREGVGPAIQSLRWLIPTAAFEMLRRSERRYMGQAEFHRALSEAGFDLLESRQTFLAEISLLAWVRA